MEPVRPVRPGTALRMPEAPVPGPLTGLLRWPLRRWLLAAPAFLVLVLLFSPLTAGGTGQPGWAWPAAVLLALPGSLILASYLPAPGTGRWLDLGCAPCAVVAAGAVVMAVLLRAGAPADPGRTALCALMLGIGLHQRLIDPARCPTTTPRAGAVPGAEQAPERAPERAPEQAPADAPAGPTAPVVHPSGGERPS